MPFPLRPRPVFFVRADTQMDEARVEQLMIEGHAEASTRVIARLEMLLTAAVAEKDATVRVAEQAVLAAIQTLGTNWSVQQKACTMITILECLLTTNGTP